MVGHGVRRSSSCMLVFTILAVAGCGPSASNDKTREAPRVTVDHPVVRSLVDEDDYNGWLEAFKTVEVRARVRGHITKVHFNDGDIVKEGQPLFDLDTAPFEAELKQVEAQSKALEAQKLAADKEVERSRIMLQTKAVSQQEFDKSEANAGTYDAQIAAKKAEADRRRLDLKYAKITADLTGRIRRPS
jgi:RND family efflux transporter MFP subunit